MARKQEQHHRRTFNVSVVGLGVSEHEKGPVGVGKSCLCNRFVRPLADDYYTDHISVLSQSDFGGRVVNNDHFLYWGGVTKTSDDGTDMTFNVVEQTEFIDDSSFQPFKCGKSTELYYKRCAETKLQSAEKLMYICKNQLGLEHEYEQKLLPDGRLSIDGFLFVFSVAATRRDKSGHDMAEVERQVDYNCRILSNLVKTKKPVVLVTSKNDNASDTLCRGAERLITRKEFKNANIPIVETSSHHNINVELAFLTVAHLIDRTKGRPKTVSYAEAARTRLELLDVAKEAFRNLLRVHVVDYKSSWSSVHKKLQRNPDYVHFVEKVGSDQARILFRKHVAQLKEEIIQRKQELYLERLQTVLPEILPDLAVIADRSWPSVCRWLQRQDIFDQLFVMTSDKIPWHCSDLVDSDDPRIPFDLTECPAAETCFRNHVNALRAEQKRTELQRQFKQLLIDKSASDSVCAGQSLNEVIVYLLSSGCFSSLCEADKNAIYEQHQRELREQAKQNFIELQLEKVELFAKYRHGNRQVTRDDLQEINEALSSDRRYKALDRLREDREVLLLNHLGFMERPSRERCPFREKCAECFIEEILHCKAHRPQSWNQHAEFLLDVANTQLSLVLLGTDGLANQLVNEIRMQCSEDEYMMDGQVYSLDYRPIEGDVSLPQNAFRAASFMPQGCFCVYNSLSTLEYLRSSLERTLISDLEQDNPVPYQGLPTVIILAHNPSLTEKGLMRLREEGQNLCDRLQCPFIDIPSSMMLDDGRRFNDDQIALAMHELIQSIQHRSSFVKPWHIAESIEPDIRILMCFMCGDDMNLSYLLTPLLSHQCCFVTSDKFPTITLETYLGDSKRKVEVVVTSYHGATVIQDSLYHGFILVYSAKRKASLRTMGSFVSNITAIPTQIMAVSEAEGASALYLNELTQSLLMEGRAIAERLEASFYPVNSNLHQQTVSYTSFFKQCWDKKACTESAFTFACDENTPVIELPVAFCGDKSTDLVANRPPAALPTQWRKGDPFDTPGSKGSTNNSQSTDSEPVYDRPQLAQCHSDSEVSSASPVIFENTTQAYSYVADNSPQPCPYDADGSTELYSEIPTPVYEDAFLRSHEGHTKRNLYTAQYRKSFPSVSASFPSPYCDNSADDSNTSSPRSLRHATGADRQPCYQFRKSNSMKLALKEDVEGVPGTGSPVEGDRQKTLKSSTLPLSCKPSDMTASGVDTAAPGSYKKSPPPTLPKPNVPTSIKSLDSLKFAEVRHILSRNMERPTMPGPGPVKAPLATPEPIEISEYAQVRDAVGVGAEEENDYALVADALPEGKLHRIRSIFKGPQQLKNTGGTCNFTFDSGAMIGGGTDSDSERSSLEREEKKETIYSRVHRKPTPHKKKHRPRQGDRSAPQLPPTNEHQQLIHSDQLVSLSEGSEETGDERQNQHKQKKKRSLRNKKKKQALQTSLVTSPPWSDSDLLSLPTGRQDVDADVPAEYAGPENYEDDTANLLESGNWKTKLRLRASEKDKQRRKEERKAKEDEKRKQKEEKKLKLQKKMIQRKKDGGRCGPTSQNSVSSTLEDLLLTETKLVPYFIEKCVCFIEEEGLSTEGLYRVPGNQVHVVLLTDKFKEDPNVDIRVLDVPVNAVATALKQFLIDLSESLVPSCLQEELIDTAGCPDITLRRAAMRAILQNKMPACNLEVLKYLMKHFHKVGEHSAENSMEPRNLAICWWPTLMRPQVTSFDKIMLISKASEEIILDLIEHHEFYFGSSVPVSL